MAVPTAEVRGADIGITAGGTLIGGRTGGSLVLERATLDVTATSDNKWRNITTGQRSWRVPFQGIYLQSTTQLTGCGVLKVADDAVTDPATMITVSTYNLEQVKTITISMSMDTIEVANCSNSDNRELLPSTRSATISFTTDYFDPANASSNAESLYADWENASPKVEYAFELGTTGTGGTTFPVFYGDGYLTNLTIDAPRDGIATLSGTIECSGTVTFDDSTTATDAGLLALIQAISPATPTSDPSTVAVVFGYDTDQDGTMETSSTRWSGNGYVTSLEVTMGYNEISSTSVEIAGTGALTRATS